MDYLNNEVLTPQEANAAIEKAFNEFTRYVYPSMTTAEKQAVIDLQGKIVFTNGIHTETATLLIGDYTWIELEPKATVTHNVGRKIFANKDTINGNVGISLTGGTIDYNHPTLSGVDFANVHAVVFQNVKGLRIENQYGLNTQKYVYLLSNITNCTTNNITFDTHSDGIHFMGPVNNIHVNDTKGVTGDNMVAFTIGDYITYKLSEGNMTNITVTNTYCDNSFEPIRFVGNTGYYFDNIVIDGVFGITESGGKVLTVIQDGTDLAYTDMRNLTIQNIYCSSPDATQISIECLSAGKIKFKNINSKNTFKPMISVSSSATISHLTIDGLYPPDNFTGEAVYVAGTISKLSVSNLDINLALDNDLSTPFRINGTVNELVINNFKQNKGHYTFKFFGSVPLINANNVTVTNVSRFLEKVTGSVGTTIINLSNSQIGYSSRFLSNSATGTNLKAKCNNVTFPNDTASRFLTGSTGTISATGYDLRVKDVASLTPDNGDIIYNTESTFQTGVGIYHRKSNAWVQL